MDGIPNNTPHVGCDFQVEWYGFDEGADVISTVSFAMQAPTGDVGLTVNGPSEVFVGEDPASGAGQDPDGVQAYTLSFDGAPHPKQGYHVKLTVNTPRSNGSDVKHKVFWVEDCEDSYALEQLSTGEEDSDSLDRSRHDEDGTEATPRRIRGATPRTRLGGLRDSGESRTPPARATPPACRALGLVGLLGRSPPRAPTATSPPAPVSPRTSPRAVRATPRARSTPVSRAATSPAAP